MADIKHSIVIDAPEERVRALVASAAGFAQWWAADSSEVADGAVELGFFNKSTAYRLRLDQSSAHELVWRCETGAEWKGTLLRFLLHDDGPATTLRFTHEDWANETDYFTNCNTTWGELIYRLKAAAEGKTRGPLFLADSLAY
jgi:uncharacterized protein YndB with AHSA1/START domain